MSGFDPYLADVLASMDPSAMASHAPVASVAPPAMSHADTPPPAPSVLPPPAAPPPVDPLAATLPPAGPPLPPAGPPLPAGPPASIAAPTDQPPPGIAAPPPDAPTTPDAQAPQGYREPNAGAFPLTAAGGGSTPAHEVDVRGPSLKAAQETQNQATDQAIKATATNSGDTAKIEYDRAQQQERDARMREAAADRSSAEMAEEAASRQRDFDDASKQLSSFAWKPDGGYWSNRSVPQKLMTMIGMAVASVGTPVGGKNPAYDAIMMEIDREVKNQENQYRGLTDNANAKQTAFSQAMKKYGDVNAARSMARASTLDAITAATAQTNALWKGTDAANRAQTLGAMATADRTAQIAQGVRYVLPQSLGRIWVDNKTGLSYTEQQAHEVAKEFRSHEQEREKIGLQTAGDVIKEQTKATATQRAKVGEHSVVMPNGDTVMAPNEAEATTLRNLIDTTNTTRRLVTEAKDIRSNSATGVPLSPSARARLEQIQQNLITNYGVQNKLGALSASDMDLAVKGTAELFNYGPGTDAKLERLGEGATAGLASRVKTYPGAPDRSTGKMPVTTTYHGDSK